MWKITAFVKDSPNNVPIAEATLRSWTLVVATVNLWEKDGFRVDVTEGRLPNFEEAFGFAKYPDGYGEK